MTKTYNDALEWAAKWIEDTLRAGPETDERTIEFGTNMAMTLRAARVQPVDDARVREIAEQVVGTVFDNTAASHETLRAVMIERIADYLLPQLSSDESRCGLCGHVGGIGDASGL